MSALARLRAVVLFFLIFPFFSCAREDSLFTSSITYCNPPESLLVQRFDVAYFPKKHSVSFNVSAASVEANVSVTANLALNVYGMHPLNITVDLCSILHGALCPLPMYNFTGSDSVSLPKSLSVVDKIPRIAYKIPDLEGYAQFLLTETRTGQVKACIQTTLSNGRSTHEPAVEWVTGGIVLGALPFWLWLSFSPDEVFPFRVLELLHFYQFIATTSFLSLNYPSAYRSFTLNFAWSMGLFSSPSGNLQLFIDRLRRSTGGKLAFSTSAAAVGFVNRKLSPYNADVSSNKQLASFSGVQTVTLNSDNILQAGFPIYVNLIGIPTANAFMTFFISSLVLVASVFSAFIVAYLAFILLKRRQSTRDKSAQISRWYLLFAKAWGIRLALLLWSPVVIFSFYQWTLRDSWLSVVFSAFAFASTLLIILFTSSVILIIAHRSGSARLSSNKSVLFSKGPLYAQYRRERFYFFLLPLASSFLKGVFIAFVTRSGEAQIVMTVVLDAFVAMEYIIFRPSEARHGHIFPIFLSVIRLITNGLLVAFIPRLRVRPIVRVVVGIVLIIVLSVTLLIIYINLLLNSGIPLFWRIYASTSTTSQGSGPELISETTIGIITRSRSSGQMERPTNPTPEQNMPRGSHYPVSPTDTAQQSTCSGDAVTLTLGSLISRRWSITPLGSPTGAIPTESRLSYARSDHEHQSIPPFRSSVSQTLHTCGQ